MRGFLVSLSMVLSLAATTTFANAEAETAINEVVEVVADKATPAKESEIPLNLDKEKKSAAEGSGVFRILFTISILGLVGAGAYVFLRKYRVPQAAKHQTQIKVIQQHYLGPKKSLAIVRVAGESILIGVTDHNISMIKSLSLLDDDIPEETPQSFGKALKKANASGASFSDQDEVVSNSAANVEAEDDEFSITGIKDIVSKRLKGMRSIQ